METILYLIRHGETDWNKQRRIQGHSDVHLNSTGEEQAERLARYFSQHRFSAVYASDLKRAYDTARRIAEAANSPLQQLDRLRERCYGEMEGLLYEEIKQQMGEVKPDESVFGIESFNGLQERASTCLTELADKHAGSTIAVVTHGGLINAFLHFISSGEVGSGVTRLENTSVTTLRYEAGNWEIVELNQRPHL